MTDEDYVKLCTSHPVLSILFNQDPTSIEQSNLKNFIVYIRENDFHNEVPNTLSEFFQNYVKYQIAIRLGYPRNIRAHFRWNIDELLEKLSKVAFLNFVKRIPISRDLLHRMLPPVNQWPDLTEATTDLEFRVLGLMKQEFDDDTQKYTKNMIFLESFVQEYLVAAYQRKECLRRIDRFKNKKTDEILSKDLKRSVHELPRSGFAWRMTFGLMHQSRDERWIQIPLMESILKDIAKNPNMTTFDLTAFCVESVYESQNLGRLADLLDYFSINQTLNYSNMPQHPDRIQYSVSAVGFLVRTSPSVYGMHMANFNLTDLNVGLLTEPVNAVSDNSVQVLNLSGNNLGSAGMEQLRRFFVKASYLSHLDLSNCNIGSTGLQILSGILMCLPLIYLKLASNSIGDRGILHLAGNLKYATTLEWLDLSDNQINYSAIKLSEALPVLTRLRNLDLRRNQIGDVSIEAMSHTLNRLDHLVQLTLSENQIGERGAVALADCVWRTNSLRHVNLSLNKISITGIKHLESAATSHGSLRISARTQSISSEKVVFPERVAELEPIIEKEEPEVKHAVSLTSIDLLAGRPDMHKKCPNRKRMGLVKRVPTMRRSWHGFFPLGFAQT